MKLILKRIFKGTDYTIGKLYLAPPYVELSDKTELEQSKYLCDTLEDTDRGLTSDMSLEDIKKVKKAGITAIPTGKYAVTLGIQSPKFKHYKQYEFCDGYLPRLTGVPGYDGILIHEGSYPSDTEGCILIGLNTKKGMVTSSRITFEKLYPLLQAANSRNESIYITVE